MNDDCTDRFSPEQFVGREDELRELISWATDLTVLQRLKTVVGPPGYGKSWLLCQLEKKLRDGNRHGQDLFLIRVPTREVTSRQHTEAWLPGVVTEARRVRPQVRPHSSETPLETVITYLLQDLCINCSPTLRLLLFVDAFDELRENERREVEKHVLEQFWTHSTVRIVMAFRDEIKTLRPASPLRRGEERLYLKAFSPEDGYNQIQKLAGPQSGLTRELLNIIPPYRSTHPGINSCLHQLAQHKIEQGQPVHFTADELRRCWISLIEDRLKRYLIPLHDVEIDLKAIVAAEDSWTLETFATTCRCDRASAQRRIDNLMALSVVTQAQSSQRYQVIDGLRELLRAEKGLREEELL